MILGKIQYRIYPEDWWNDIRPFYSTVPQKDVKLIESLIFGVLYIN